MMESLPQIPVTSFLSNLVQNLSLNVDKKLLNQNLDFIEDPVVNALK